MDAWMVQSETFSCLNQKAENVPLYWTGTDYIQPVFGNENRSKN